MLLIGYNCKTCGVQPRDVEVRNRAPEEDVENYVYHCARKCGEDHAKRSPKCRAQAIDLCLPVPKEDGRIGDP